MNVHQVLAPAVIAGIVLTVGCAVDEVAESTDDTHAALSGSDSYQWRYTTTDTKGGCNSCQFACDAMCTASNVGGRKSCKVPGTVDNYRIFVCAGPATSYKWVYSGRDRNGCHSCSYGCGAACNASTVGQKKRCSVGHNDDDVYICTSN